MIIKNLTNFPIPINVPDVLNKKIRTFANCDIYEKEVKLFNNVLYCIANHLSNDNIDLTSLYSLNVFFVGNNELTFVEDKPGTCGNQFYIAIYQMDKIRNLNNELIMAVMFAEELTHYYWRIFDETEVKYKIVEILNDIYPELTTDTLKEWKMNGL